MNAAVTRPSLLERMNSTNDGQPIFLFSGAYGDAAPFVYLSRHLAATHPCFVLLAPGLYREEPAVSSYEDLARRQLDDIRTVQPAGPYLLLGYSAGGRTAWEIGQLLAQEGERASVGLLDTWAPDARVGVGWPRRLFKPLEQVWMHARIVAPLPWRRKRSFVRELFRRRVRKVAERLPERLGNPIIAWVFTVGRPRPPGHNEVRKGLNKAFKEHVPQPYHGSTTLFRARIREAAMREDPLLGWGDLTPGGLEVVHVPGDHKFMLFEPHVATLAREIEAWAARSVAVR